MTRSHLQKGDVLLSIVGTIGELSLVTTNKPATCSCKLAILRPHSVSPEYLAIFLRSDFGRSQIERLTRGAVQTGVLLEDTDQIAVFRLSSSLEQRIRDLVTEAHFQFGVAEQQSSRAEKVLLRSLALEEWQPPARLTYTCPASEAFAAARLDAEFYDPGTLEILRLLQKQESFRLSDVATVGTGFPWKSDYFLKNGAAVGQPFVRIRNCKPGELHPDDLDKLQPDYATAQGQPKAKTGDLVLGMDGLQWFYLNYAQIQRSHRRWSCGGSGSRVNSVI